jgi:hypothetical protein
VTTCRSSISFAGAGVQCGLDEHPESEDHSATVRAEYGAMDTWMPERGDTEATLTWSAPVVGATLEERRAYVLAARAEQEENR